MTDADVAAAQQAYTAAVTAAQQACVAQGRAWSPFYTSPGVRAARGRLDAAVRSRAKALAGGEAA